MSTLIKENVEISDDLRTKLTGIEQAAAAHKKDPNAYVAALTPDADFYDLRHSAEKAVHTLSSNADVLDRKTSTALIQDLAALAKTLSVAELKQAVAAAKKIIADAIPNIDAYAKQKATEENARRSQIVGQVALGTLSPRDAEDAMYETRAHFRAIETKLLKARANGFIDDRVEHHLCEMLKIISDKKDSFSSTTAAEWKELLKDTIRHVQTTAKEEMKGVYSAIRHYETDPEEFLDAFKSARYVTLHAALVGYEKGTMTHAEAFNVAACAQSPVPDAKETLVRAYKVGALDQGDYLQLCGRLKDMELAIAAVSPTPSYFARNMHSLEITKASDAVGTATLASDLSQVALAKAKQRLATLLGEEISPEI